MSTKSVEKVLECLALAMSEDVYNETIPIIKGELELQSNMIIWLAKRALRIFGNPVGYEVVQCESLIAEARKESQSDEILL
uniref:Uncharacterized protein n=1 Tax=viral metagenome TaxID=1070528 RepID=A0A6M3LU67_9ZZZZ